MITQEQLKEWLNYDPETGHFVWKKEKYRVIRKSKSRIGDRAGYKLNSGYRILHICNERIVEQRAAWLFVNGKFTKDVIDHINGIRDDNRISNLRELSNQKNGENRTKKRSGSNIDLPIGVSMTKENKKKKYVAKIMRNYVGKYLGYFETPEEARAAYIVAKIMAE